MNIKKFEARSMKEALDMVKTQLGPDAVILSAKEVTKGFGLGGVKSIEITAAYSENVLKQKQFVQSRMPQSEQSKFDRIPARSQKEIMQKMIEEKLSRQHQHAPTRVQQPVVQRATPASSVRMTQKKYIEIDNEHLKSEPTTISARMEKPVLTQQAQQAWSNMEVQSLKSEIDQLKQLMGQFKSMPQGFVQGHPGADLGVGYKLSPLFIKLVDRGLLPEIAADILNQAQNQIDPIKLTNPQYVEAWIGRYILNSTPVVQGGFEQFQLFLGPSGSGKTTSMIKLASHLVLNHKKRVALISTDTIKVGADEQMKIFSQILNLPFISVRSQNDWSKVVPFLNQVDHVLVDFASMNLRSESEVKFLKKMMPPVTDSMRSHLVLSAKLKDSDLADVATRYKAMDFHDIIFTSVDEATQYGNIYNFVRKMNTPLFGFGIGPKVPEDFERASAERVLDLILEVTKNHRHQDMSQTAGSNNEDVSL